MATTVPRSISAEPPPYPGMDYNFLLEEGFRHIRRLAGESWTDHNAHDPGITILEQLCYALTDLAYRVNFDVEDLLAGRDGGAFDSLPGPARILTVSPVTTTDIRKVVIDVEGVKNAWVEPLAKPRPDLFYDPAEHSLHLTDHAGALTQFNMAGLYRVLFEKQENYASSAVYAAVKARLMACRGLCEDYAEIRLLEPGLITLSGTVEVGQVEEMEKFAAQLLFRIAQLISPQIRFYTITEMLAMGKSPDEIFDGPALQHGFIDEEQLFASDRRTELHVSDIIRELMDVHGVVGLHGIALTGGPSGSRSSWVLELDAEKASMLDPGTLKELRFVRNGLPVYLDQDRTLAGYQELLRAEVCPPLEPAARDLVPEEGRYRDPGSYQSIQNHFPAIYGIGKYGLPAAASPQRQAEAKNLKSYLLLFEQILADHFQQLGHLRELFSFHERKPATYFRYQLLQKQTGVRNLIKDYGKYARFLSYPEKADAIKPESDSYRWTEKNLERKNRFLNHLLARFGESLADYSLAPRSGDEDPAAQGQAPPRKRAGKKPTEQALPHLQELIRRKSSFLSDYALLSNDRGKAFDYSTDSWGNNNISGLERRVAAKLGILNFSRRPLAGSNTEGFHAIEHILLRPLAEEADTINAFLLPRNIYSFRNLGNDLVRCESPDHGLRAGELIHIKHPAHASGPHEIKRALANYFDIQTPYVATEVGAVKPSWIRTSMDTRFLVLTQHPLASFSDSENAGRTVCHSPGHGLDADEQIRIVGTKSYDGRHLVLNPETDSFEIEQAFVSDDGPGGRWLREDGQDPYSLQISFVFPGWLPRFDARNTDFRNFVAKTVREQTPAHLKVYVRWLEQQEMRLFDGAYKNFSGPAKQQPVMTKANNFTLRQARDAVMDRLGLGGPLPVSDLPLAVTDKIVSFGSHSFIIISNSQPGVSYLLYRGRELISESRGNGGDLKIETDGLTEEDYTFGIVARKGNQMLPLMQTAFVAVGVDVSLPVKLAESVIDYGTKAQITIPSAQSNTRYELVGLSGEEKGEGRVETKGTGDIDLYTPELAEDAVIRIRATNLTTNLSGILRSQPAVLVAPDTRPTATVRSAAAYGGKAFIDLAGTQDSTRYQLKLEEVYGGDPVPADLEVMAIVDGDAAKVISLAAGPLREDVTVSIVAVKKESGLTRSLPFRLVIPVKPDPDRDLTLVQDSSGPGSDVVITEATPGYQAVVRVGQPQYGVLYQLRKGGADIGAPVYHHRNFGIGKARIEIEFVVDRFDGKDVYLPAGVVTEKSTFSVFAYKPKREGEGVSLLGAVTVETGTGKT